MRLRRLWLPGCAQANPSVAPSTLRNLLLGLLCCEPPLQALEVAPAHILIVMEATGVYWEKLALSLVQTGFVVSVIHPPQAHDFAKALLKRAKTDAIDAQTLAQFAERFEPPPWTPPTAISVALEQRLQEREAWLSCRQRVRNQLHALLQTPEVAPTVLRRMQEVIETVTSQIAAGDRGAGPDSEPRRGVGTCCSASANHHGHWFPHRSTGAGDHAQFHPVWHG